MSHTNQTPNYHLPQFIGTDKPAWLVDFNEAMSGIDTQMKANETAAGTAEADAQSALSGVTALNSQVGGIQTSVTALETQAPLDEAQIETNRQNIATNAQNIVDLDNRMGHTSISGIGDGSATGAIKAVDDKVGDLADLDTTDKSSIVDAINEVVAGGSGDEATVRYDPATNWVQCKDAEGWFNWLKASRKWDAVENQNLLYGLAKSSYGVPTIVNGVGTFTVKTSTTGSGDNGIIWVNSPATSPISVTIAGTVAGNASGTGGKIVKASVPTGDDDACTTLARLDTNGTFNQTYTLSAGEYIGIWMANNGSPSLEFSVVVTTLKEI